MTRTLPDEPKEFTRRTRPPPPFDSTALGDLFGYEAGGSLKRAASFNLDDPSTPIDESVELQRRNGYTGKPARFTKVEQVWITYLDNGNLYFDDISDSSRDQALMAITHFDRDVLRAIYRHPIAYERIELSNRGADDSKVHAYTRARLPTRRQRNAPPPAPPAIPLDRRSVVDHWYADRAVPYPTMLETRDDEHYVTVDSAGRHSSTGATRIRELLAQPVELQRSYERGRTGTRQTFDAYRGALEEFVTFLGS